MIEITEAGTSITGDDILAYRTLAARRALKLEIETGMQFSRGVNMIKVANGITGGTSRTRIAAYAALDRYIVANLGMPSVPLKGK